MTYDRILFIILITLQICKGQIVFRNNEGYDFTEPLRKTTVYSQFDECTTCKHYYTANFKKDDHIFVQVFVPPSSIDVVTVIKMIGPQTTKNYDAYTLDSVNLVAHKNIFEIDTTSESNRSVILEIVTNSPHAHYGVRMGSEANFNILDVTIKFGVVVQSLRWWNNTFLYFVFLTFTSVIYFLTFPLHRFKSYVVLPKIAALSYLSWVFDAFYQFFFITKYTSSFSILSFILHIVPNLTCAILLNFVYEQTRNKELWLIVISCVSLVYGGGGLYIGFASLLLSYVGLMTMKQTNEGKDNKKLFCNLTV